MSPSGDASSELQTIVEQLVHLQNLSRQVVNEFSKVSKSFDNKKFTIRKLKLGHEEMKQELAKGEA